MSMARRMLTTLGRPKLASFLKRWTIPRPPPRNLNPAQGPSWTRSHLYLTDDTEAYHLPVHIPSHRSILNYPITTSENLTAYRGFFAGGVVVQDRSEGVVLDCQPHASGNLYQTPLGPGQGNVGGRKASDCGHGVLAFWRWRVPIPLVNMLLIRLYISRPSSLTFFNISFLCHDYRDRARLLQVQWPILFLC